MNQVVISTTSNNTNVFQPVFVPTIATLIPVTQTVQPTVVFDSSYTLNNYNLDPKLTLKQLMLSNNLKIEDLIELMKEMAIEEVLDS